jgi:CubicO group peptidase (beta-lactamase class C family)
MQPGGTGPTGPEIRLRPNYIRNCNKTAPLDLTFKGDDSYSLRAGAEYKKYEFASQSFRYEHGEGELAAAARGIVDPDADAEFLRPWQAGGARQHADLLGDAQYRLVQQASRYRYNSATAYTAGILVAKATGQTMADFARKSLFTPLGIRDWG